MPATRTVRRRVTVAARVTLGLAAASVLLGAGPPARAQTPTPPTLGGFNGSAAASGLHVEYNPEGLLPLGPPVDLGAPDALATIASGPATFARASVADPGDLLANPDFLLTSVSPEYPQGSVPPYPFRIAAGSGVGEPAAESAPAPGLHARVTAGDGVSTAEATAPAVDAPAVVTIGSMASYADTRTDGASVTVHARSELSGIDILGVLRIETIVTDLTATSSGNGTSFEGGTVVTGATVAGQPAAIDDQGIRATGVDVGALLGPLGITVTLPGPVEQEGGPAGQLASTGLRIEIAATAATVPGLTDALDALPPIEPVAPGAPGVEDVLAAARANHVTEVQVGRGIVSLTARSAAPRVARPAAPTPASASLLPPVGVAGPSPASSAPAVPAAPAPVVTAQVPAVSVRSGIGALAVLLLLVQPFIGDRLARAAAAQLATHQEGCPWE